MPDHDPLKTMIILECSGDKAHGGERSIATHVTPWIDDLLEARRRVAAYVQIDASRLMPAWQRYIGTFYESCQPTLASAVAADAKIVIISGGYGVVMASEPIGDYKRVFRLSDWGPGEPVQRALIRRAEATHAEIVVAFVARSTDYAKVVCKTPWHQLGLPTYLVARRRARDGAQYKVPLTLAKAFTAYWGRNPDQWPYDVVVERLA